MATEMEGGMPRYWRLQKIRYRLQGEMCNTCGIPMFPPRDVCPNCVEQASTNRKENANLPNNHLSDTIYHEEISPEEKVEIIFHSTEINSPRQEQDLDSPQQ